jgi:type I restriction enzyme S subunit
MTWPMVKLSDVCQVNPRLPKTYDENQEVSFLAMASVSEDGKLITQETRILGETKKGFTYFERGDVIVAKITPCFENGKAVYLEELNTQIGFGSTEFHVLRPYTEQLNGKYLFYLIWNSKFRAIAERSMSGSAGQKRVPADFFKNYEIPLPPLAEQKRIAAILDKADAIRQKRQQAIAIADQFLLSVFLDMFGNAFSTVGYDLCNKKKIKQITTYIDYRGKTPEKSESGIPLITAKNVKVGYISDEPREYIPSENYMSWMTRGKPEAKDVLFTTEAPLGNVALLGNYEKVAIGQRIVALRPKNEIRPEYLMFSLLHPFIQGIIESRSSGSTAKGIRTKELYDIEIPLAELSKQDEFAKMYWHVISMTNKISASNKISDTLTDSLSSKAFSGQL